MPGVTGIFVTDGLKAGCRLICLLRDSGRKRGVAVDADDPVKPKPDESLVFSWKYEYPVPQSKNSDF